MIKEVLPQGLNMKTKGDEKNIVDQLHLNLPSSQLYIRVVISEHHIFHDSFKLSL